MNEQQHHIEKLKRELADTYSEMNWVTEDAARTAEQTRAALIADIFSYDTSRWQFSETKLVSHDLSQGCRLCGGGDWSCLFINNRCNARCFYCPTTQEDDVPPASGRVEFPTPADYADYVAAFDIKGVGFSGGEPFLNFDRVLSYLCALTNTSREVPYTWMYTNGILATEDKLKALADKGLNEIRFDLSANHYTLDALSKAVGIIPKVTVEIPAIPEDLSITRPLLRTLKSAGVDFLNLHQIRCTPFNIPKLIKRGYTFTHGAGATVMETELAALELIRHGLTQGIDLPVNYCAFTYRNQFQRAGAQKRNAARVKEAYESVTRTGLIRTLGLMGEPSALKAMDGKLRDMQKDPGLWQLSPKADRLRLHPSLMPEVSISGLRLQVDHSGTSLSQTLSYRNRFREIPLNPGKRVVVERFLTHPGVVVPEDQIREFQARYLEEGTGQGKLPDSICQSLDSFEFFTSGLHRYY